MYGKILQIHLDESDVTKANILVSYVFWSIQDYKKGRANVRDGSGAQSYDKLDTAIEVIEKDKPTIWHFVRSGKFSAIEVHLKSRKNNLHIFDED